jgi:hypothetical protein
MGSTELGDQGLTHEPDALGRVRRPAQPDGEVRPGDGAEDARDASPIPTGGVDDDGSLVGEPLPERPRDQLPRRADGVNHADSPFARLRAKSLASQVV